MAFITRKVVKGPGGRPHVVFIDTKTGEEVPFSEIGQHQMIEHGVDLDIPKRESTKTEEAKDELLEGEEVKRLFQDGGSVLDDPDYYSSQFGGERNISSNFGYMSKPEALGLLGMLPGIPGLIGKSINASINLNNTMAVNQAREFMGFEPMSPVDIAKGVAMGNKGYVGDMVVGDKQYAVGFEALTEDGRTTLTLNEANARATKAALQGIEAREATKEEVKAAAEEHEKEFGKERSGGLLGPVKDAVRSVTDPLGQAVRSVTDPIGRGLTGRPSTTQAPSQTRATPTAQPGKGLASLAPNGLTGGVGRTTNFGPQTVGPAQEDLSRAVELATENVFGPGYTVNQTSGARTNSQNHMDGQAVDFNVTAPDGSRVTNQQQLEAFAAELGRQGIQSLGYGKGYMGPGMMHAGMAPSPLGATSWGAGGRQVNADPGVKQAFQSELTPGVGILPFEDVPTPVARPEEVEVPAMSLAPTENKQTMAQKALEGLVSGNLSQGYMGGVQQNIPPEVLNEMAMTIAGELGSETIAGIRSGDSSRIAQARDEIANIGHTMVNRSRATPTGSWSHVVDSRQYNSRMGQNMGTTSRNYGLVGDFIGQTLGDFNTGALTGSAPNATHYRATYVNPEWANFATNQVRSGEHIFSNVNQPGTGRQEYLPALPDRGFAPGSRPDASSSGVGIGGDSTGFGGGSFGGSGGYGEPGGSSPGFGGGSGSSGVSGGSSGSGSSGGSSGGSKGSGSSGGSSGGYAPGGSGGGAFGDSIGAGGSGGSSLGGGIGLGSTGSSGAGGNSSGVGSAGQAGFGGMSAGSLGGSASGFGSGYGSVGSGGAQSGFSGSGGTGGSGNNNQGGFTVDITYDKDVGGSSGGGGGDKVICGYFYAKGKIPKKIYLGDLKYSRDFAHPRTKAGYQLWAIPLVKFLDKKPSRPVIDRLLFPFTKGWVYEMAYRVGFTKERSLWGRIVTPVVSGMCYTLGFIKEKI